MISTIIILFMFAFIVFWMIAIINYLSSIDNNLKKLVKQGEKK